MTITIYGADWCGDCRRSRAWFNDQGIDFVYVNLENDATETARVLERTGGSKRIPVIVFADESHLIEPTNDELAAKMVELAETSGPPVIENVHLQRFELLHNGDVVSFADYREHDSTVTVPHVETQTEHRGNGYADELLAGMLAILRATSRKIVPQCPFAAAYIDAHEEYRELLA